MVREEKHQRADQPPWPLARVEHATSLPFGVQPRVGSDGRPVGRTLRPPSSRLVRGFSRAWDQTVVWWVARLDPLLWFVGSAARGIRRPPLAVWWVAIILHTRKSHGLSRTLLRGLH